MPHAAKVAYESFGVLSIAVCPPSAIQHPASAVTPPSQLVGCSVARLTPSTSQLVPLRFLQPHRRPPLDHWLSCCPFACPLFRQHLCLSLRPSICWLLGGIVGPLHLLVVAFGLPPSPISHASASRQRRQWEVVIESCCHQSRDQHLHLQSS
jgi:hypothetical protein